LPTDPDRRPTAIPVQFGATHRRWSGFLRS
jgi:hypothetical protein